MHEQSGDSLVSNESRVGPGSGNLYAYIILGLLSFECASLWSIPDVLSSIVNASDPINSRD